MGEKERVKKEKRYIYIYLSIKLNKYIKVLLKRGILSEERKIIFKKGREK